jgi:hypothetical protein
MATIASAINPVNTEIFHDPATMSIQNQSFLAGKINGSTFRTRGYSIFPADLPGP